MEIAQIKENLTTALLLASASSRPHSFELDEIGLVTIKNKTAYIVLPNGTTKAVTKRKIDLYAQAFLEHRETIKESMPISTYLLAGLTV